MVDVEEFVSSRGGRALIFTSTDGQSNPSSTSTVKPKDRNGEMKESPLQSSQMALAVCVDKPRSNSPILEFPEESTVRLVRREIEKNGRLNYEVEFEDGHIETMLAQRLVILDKGKAALSDFQENPHSALSSSSSREGSLIRVTTESLNSDSNAESDRPPLRQLRKKRPLTYLSGGDDEEDSSTRSRPLKKRGSLRLAKGRKDSSESSDELTLFKEQPKSLTKRTRILAESKKQVRKAYSSKTESSSEDSDSDDMGTTRRKRQSRFKSFMPSKHTGSRQHSVHRRSVRQSQRSTRNVQNMAEPGLEDVYRSDSEREKQSSKPVGAKEFFQTLPAGNPFRLRHTQQCESCGKYGGGALGQLIHCQGCTVSYHRTCISYRATREHLVTKIGDHDFVLQCRRCVNAAQRKETTNPNQSMCQDCREAGQSCHPFRDRKSLVQEEREREQNNGEDPITPVNPQLINNANNVLFRCVSCWRAFHFHHLRPKSDAIETGDEEDRIASRRFVEYSRDWQCLECSKIPARVGGLVAWRPVNAELYTPGASAADMSEDDKEYLLKWVDLSYFQCQWMPGAWTWGYVAPAMLHAFTRRNAGVNLPSLTTEDAIPEEYLRIGIVLDVEFTSKVDTQSEEVDKARIREVASVYCKYKGLGYEDAVWEKPPTPDDGDRWVDFVTAYEDWVAGRHIRYPKSYALKARIDKARATDFNVLEKKKQPTSLVGGELMKYQLDGLNWLYYRWHTQKNGILADEMGLGKTIQIIGLLATLVQDHQCFPFLIVVPNSTCPNWRREIKQWASNLRVVTYFGSAEARNLMYRYELYPNGSTQLRCHVVVTSYESAADDSSQKFLKSVSWQGLFVDEGQRLKNDKNLLYGSLDKLSIPFRILLTGTPLQNNARELFNLLQFLDKDFNASKLELEYAELTKDNVPQLHDLIRPFFLRRTKAQVLTFLPPMAQIITPISMSIVQMKLCQSILSRQPELIRAIFDPSRRNIASSERAQLNNIFMQLRKCLCHPFVYSKEIEERNVTAAASHRNLVEASGKLQLLEVLLPKLKERGHRVLIFSQFLDMLDILEDFLDGLQLQYQRLDGSISSLQKQKRIDEFNEAGSPLFAFLLSTRAGGVGINLATADTVIILDPDFNPHQDIQALSRAHRIGQKKKVLCIQVMTQSSVEEKVMQIGRKKMALDHILIENLDSNEEESLDVASILRHGAADILEGKTQETRYDGASIEKLLDRSQIEDTRSGEDNSAESQFSFARVWANDTESMADSIGSEDEAERAPNQDAWEKILKEREQLAAAEAAARFQAFGRGKRARHAVNYELPGDAPEAQKAQLHPESSSDTDFQAEQKRTDEDSSDSSDDEDGNNGDSKRVDPSELLDSPTSRQTPTFTRSTVVWPLETETANTSLSNSQDGLRKCPACGIFHRKGFCPLKLAGVEFCNLCGLAHLGTHQSGYPRPCPHIGSETQVMLMLQALKQSPEPKHLVETAKKYLKGVKGSIVQERNKRRETAERQALRLANAGTNYNFSSKASMPTSNSVPTALSAPASASQSSLMVNDSAAPVAPTNSTQSTLLKVNSPQVTNPSATGQPTPTNRSMAPLQPPYMPHTASPDVAGAGVGGIGVPMNSNNATLSNNNAWQTPPTYVTQDTQASQFRIHYNQNPATLPQTGQGPTSDITSGQQKANQPLGNPPYNPRQS